MEALPQRYLTTAQAAAYTGRPENTIRGWAARGLLNPARVDRIFLFDRRDIDALMESAKITG